MKNKRPLISSIVFDSVVAVVCTTVAIASKHPFSKVAFAFLAISIGSSAIKDIEARRTSEDVL